MKKGLSLRFAFGNLRKNYRFFVPRVLAEIGLVIGFYIIFTLACDDRLASVEGGNYLPTFMWMGAGIVFLLSFVLMLYTNSFLMKQRKREFGLYSVLGMEKKHICRILFHESFLCSLFSILSGLLFGMLFYKIASLAICRLLEADIVAGFYYLSAKTVLPAGAVFFGIDLVTFLVNVVTIGRMKPVDLLASVNTGEKEPKVKWVLLLLGVLSLGAGYTISLTTESPLKAIMLFFAAVLLVIAGTYFLFVSGSIFLLKALKKRESYYYQPSHVTSVSGLLYRMKQNAVGLASVAILSTGVLVMLSSTFCLYSRIENTLEETYPQDYYLSASFHDEEGNPETIPEEEIALIVKKNAEKHGLTIREAFLQEYFAASFTHKPGNLIADRESVSIEEDLSDICHITFISEATYVKLGGNPLGLGKNEVAVHAMKKHEAFGDSFFSLFGNDYTVAEVISDFPINFPMITVNTFGMVVADDSVLLSIYEGQKEAYGYNASEWECRYCVSFTDRSRILRSGDEFASDVSLDFWDLIEAKGHTSYSVFGYDAVWNARESLYGMFGTLLFLGVLLGIVFLFATVLIIYYKQISEGYEDRNRYQIMRKIGMTDAEVKKTISDQITLVFFLPLITAGVHVAFAYPILSKMMEVLLFDGIWRYAVWCLIVYLVFALVYTVIYKLTARTYYKIVN